MREIAKQSTLALHETKHFFSTPYLNIVPNNAHSRSDVTVQSFSIARNKFYTPIGSSAVGYGRVTPISHKFDSDGNMVYGHDGTHHQRDHASGYAPYPINMARIFPDPTQSDDWASFCNKYDVANIHKSIPRYSPSIFENISRKNCLEGHELMPSVARCTWTFMRPKVRMLNDAYDVQVMENSNNTEAMQNLGRCAAGTLAGLAIGAPAMAATQGISFGAQVLDIALNNPAEEDDGDGRDDVEMQDASVSFTPTNGLAASTTNVSRRKLNFEDDATDGSSQARSAGLPASGFADNAANTDLYEKNVKAGAVLFTNSSGNIFWRWPIGPEYAGDNAEANYATLNSDAEDVSSASAMSNAQFEMVKAYKNLPRTAASGEALNTYPASLAAFNTLVQEYEAGLKQMDARMNYADTDILPYAFRFIRVKFKHSKFDAPIPSPQADLFLDNYGVPCGAGHLGINGNDIECMPINTAKYQVLDDRRFTLGAPMVHGGNATTGSGAGTQYLTNINKPFVHKFTTYHDIGKKLTYQRRRVGANSTLSHLNESMEGDGTLHATNESNEFIFVHSWVPGAVRKPGFETAVAPDKWLVSVVPKSTFKDL